MNTSEKLILSFLKKNDQTDLVERFLKVVSMARSRQQVLTKINGLSDTLFQHIILYVLFKKNNLIIPKTWHSEIQTYLDSIDALNSGKNKKWLTPSQIMNNLNDLLVLKTRRLVDKKLSDFPEKTQKIINKDLDKFFQNPKLENLDLSLKYIKDRLIFFIGTNLF